MNYAHAIKLRPKSRRGPEPKLSEIQLVELLAWHKARKHLGSYKEWRRARKALGTLADKARELGVREGSLRDALRRAMKREIQ